MSAREEAENMVDCGTEAWCEPDASTDMEFSTLAVVEPSNGHEGAGALPISYIVNFRTAFRHLRSRKGEMLRE
jgi:hypothetical protein